MHELTHRRGTCLRLRPLGYSVRGAETPSGSMHILHLNYWFDRELDSPEALLATGF